MAIQSLSIGLSALTVNQRVIDLLGQNLANAGTKGYHRQLAELSNVSVGQEIGLGVEIKQYRRMANNLLDEAVTRNSSETETVNVQLETMRQVQTMVSAGDGSVHDLMEKFFNQVEQLAVRPSDLAQRRVVLASAAGLTDKLNALNNDMLRLSEGLDDHGRRYVAEINSLTPRIAELNVAISRNLTQGVSANDLIDQRDQLINNLAELVNVQVIPQEFGLVNVIGGGAPLVIGTTAGSLEYAVDTNTNIAQVRLPGITKALNPAEGKLAGLLSVRNEQINAVRADMDTITQTLVRTLDGLHATGLPLTGSATMLEGHRSVNNVLVPLANANLGFPPTAGSLFVSVTNQATGQRTLSEIAIDPNTQSLQDVANALSGVSNIQGVVDPQTNTLRVLSRPGYTVDFSARLASEPQNVSITGTTTAAVQGQFSGTQNDNYTFTVVGSGTIGVTPNLTLEVRNQAGALIDTLSIGQGYSPGSELKGINGIEIKMSGGTANAGDSFQVRVLANSDTAGILTALGINTFFSGQDASNIAVRADLLDNPERLNASLNGDAGDAANLRRMAGLRDQQVLASGTASLREYYAALVGDVGSQVQDLSQKQTAKQTLGESLEAERQAVSGVDPNEELMHMMQSQRSFQMSAKYLAIVNEILGDLKDMVG